MLDKIKALALRYEDLQAQLADPDVYGDAARLRDLNRELKELEPVAEACQAWQTARERREEAETLLHDPEFRDLAQEEPAAAPAPGGMRRQGLYRLSRNPMYLAYLVFFAGCALLVRSPLLLAITAVFQLSAHWVILAEERWCIRQFGQDYIRYMAEVRRYL